MVIDTSVLIAILANEPDAELFEAAIDANPVRLISAASVLETAIVAGARFGELAERSAIIAHQSPEPHSVRFESFVVPITTEQLVG